MEHEFDNLDWMIIVICLALGCTVVTLILYI